MPGRPPLRGREGRWGWTRRGATLFLVGPFVAAALAAAVAWGGGAWGPVAPVAALTAAALLTLGVVRRTWAVGGAPPERLLRHAWTLLAPRLHENGFVARGLGVPGGAGPRHAGRRLPAAARTPSRFPAQAHRRRPGRRAGAAGPPRRPAPPHGRGRRRRRRRPRAAGRGPTRPLLRGPPAAGLRAAPARRMDRRLVDATATSSASAYCCATGRSRRGSRCATCSTPAARPRPWATVLGVGDPAGLAALRLLWSERPTRPWDHCGPTQTVFELAADPAHAELLGRASRPVAVAA